MELEGGGKGKENDSNIKIHYICASGRYNDIY
jgi:hypothetical protein